jgi:hypothetical protein
LVICTAWKQVLHASGGPPEVPPVDVVLPVTLPVVLPVPEVVLPVPEVVLPVPEVVAPVPEVVAPVVDVVSPAVHHIAISCAACAQFSQLEHLYSLPSLPTYLHDEPPGVPQNLYVLPPSAQVLDVHASLGPPPPPPQPTINRRTRNPRMTTSALRSLRAAACCTKSYMPAPQLPLQGVAHHWHSQA